MMRPELLAQVRELLDDWRRWRDAWRNAFGLVPVDASTVTEARVAEAAQRWEVACG